MEEHVEPDAEHHALGQQEEQTTPHRGQDQCESRRDTGEVWLFFTRQQNVSGVGRSVAHRMDLYGSKNKNQGP